MVSSRMLYETVLLSKVNLTIRQLFSNGNTKKLNKLYTNMRGNNFDK